MPEAYVHPTFDGDRTGGTGVSPAGWLRDNIRAWFNPANIAAIMRGEPTPMSKRDGYPGGLSPVEQPEPNGDFSLLLTRRYDRGALAYGYRFGYLTYDPIGGGVVTTRPMVATLPAGNEPAFGNEIFWGPQMINYGIQPMTGPLLDPQTAAALMGNPALAGSIPSAEYVAPFEGGFGG